MNAEPIPVEVVLVFEPLHKRAFGMAIGIACGLFFFGLTVIGLLRDPQAVQGLYILDEYFYGYTVSWPGAFVALAWGFVAGFAAGWFAAFCRNFIIAASLWSGRNKAELAASADFLDHI